MVEKGKGEASRPPWRLHAGRVIGRILKEHGIKYAFGVFGGHVLALDTGFYEHGIKRLHVRHEQAGVFAADAYARCTRTPGICYGTAGPGVTNMVTPLEQAFLVRSPIVAFFGQHARDENLRGPLQEAYGVEICSTLCKWGAFIPSWQLVPFYVRKALRDCITYPPGPVVLAADRVTLNFAGEEGTLVGDVSNAVKASPSPPAGDPKAVEQAVRLVLASERPAIVAGDGVYWSDAAEELQEFAEMLQIPTNTRRLARGALPEDHPLAVKGAWRLQFWQDADVILGMGIKLTNLENYGEPPVWPKGAKRIIIHESQTDAWAPVPSVLEIIGSPKLVLRQMIECARSLMGQRPERKDWLDKLAAVRSRYDASIEEMLIEVRERKPIHGFLLAKEIVDFLDPTATIIYDSYGGSAQLTDKITAKFAGQILDAGEHAGVGHGIGMGIGAQLARPGKQVLVMIGDGGLGIGGMDIETALRYHLPVVYVVYNNSAWMGGMENLYFRGQIDSWDMLPNLRYDRMFKTIGCHGEYVTKPQEIRPALERAFNSGKTAVVNVIVDSRVPNPSLLNAGRLAMATTDPSKWSDLTRDLIMNGYTPEVEEKFRKAGWPPMRLKAKIPRAEGARLWKG